MILAVLAVSVALGGDLTVPITARAARSLVSESDVDACIEALEASHSSTCTLGLATGLGLRIDRKGRAELVFSLEEPVLAITDAWSVGTGLRLPVHEVGFRGSEARTGLRVHVAAYGIVGVVLGARVGDGWTVAALVTGRGAEAAGIRPGDILVAADGVALPGELDATVARLGGPTGSTVALTLGDERVLRVVRTNVAGCSVAPGALELTFEPPIESELVACPIEAQRLAYAFAVGLTTPPAP